MAVKIVVAVTDGDWFKQLRSTRDLQEVNFWSPSPRSFRALQPGELFLFKLHAPINMIVGGGVYASSTVMPLSLAWEAFGTANGVANLADMRARILRYRRTDAASLGPLEIGCRVLTQPFFLSEEQWFAPPASWSPNIVSFTSYSTDTTEGMALWSSVEDAMRATAQRPGFSEPQARYGEPTLIRPPARSRRVPLGRDRPLLTSVCSHTGANATRFGGRTYSALCRWRRACCKQWHPHAPRPAQSVRSGLCDNHPRVSF